MNRQKRQPVTKDQITDWSENPVTLELLEQCKLELQDIQDTSCIDCFFPGEPQKTQENLVELESRERFWESWVSVLSGDWSYFEEEDEDE